MPASVRRAVRPPCSRWQGRAVDDGGSPSDGLAPQTPVLLVDGSWRPAGDLAVGDRVVGTRESLAGDGYRHWVGTEVLARAAVAGRAHATSLVDGTRLVSGGDQGVLTARGWVPVAGTDALLTGDMLLGPGRGADRAPSAGSPVIREAAADVVVVDDLGVELPLVVLTTGAGDLVADGVVCRAGPR